MANSENTIGRGPVSGEYRFPVDFLPPAAPEGKVVTKFDGAVAFIAAPQPGDERNKAGYTAAQVADLEQLALARDMGKLERRPLHGTSVTIVEFPAQA